MRLRPSKSTLLLSLAIIIFTAVFFSLAAYKYQTFRFGQEDLAIFNNVFFNTVHGRPFWFTIHGGYSYLGDHLELTLLLIVPFYYFFQFPLTLLFLQIFLYALAAWPLYLILTALTQKSGGQKIRSEDLSEPGRGRREMGAGSFEAAETGPPLCGGGEFRSKNLLPAALSIIYLLNPFIQNLALEEFHAAPLMLFFFLWTVYFYFKKRYRPFLLFFVLTLLSREDAALTLGALTLIAAWDHRRALWQNKKWWLYPLIGAIIWFFVASQIIAYFSPENDYKYLLLYRNLIANLSRPWLIFLQLFAWKNLPLIAGYLLTFLFLPLYRPKFLLLALPTALQIFLMDADGTSVLYNTHYQIFILAALFLATASALNALPKKRLILAVALLAAAQVYTSFYFGPLQFFVDTQKTKTLSKLENQQINRDVLKLIPAEAAVSAPYRLLPHLSGRGDIYVNKLSFLGKRHLSTADFILPANVDYFLLDTADMVEYYLHFKNRRLQNPLYWGGAGRLRALFEERGFNPIFIADNLVLFRRGAPASAPLYSIGDKIPADLKGEKKDLGAVEFLGWRKNEAGLTELWWRAKQPIKDDYFLEFIFTDAAGKTWNKIYPPAFGLLPTHDWPTDKIIMTAQSFTIPSQTNQIKLDLVKIEGDIELDYLNSVRLIADKKEIVGELYAPFSNSQEH